MGQKLRKQRLPEAESMDGRSTAPSQHPRTLAPISEYVNDHVGLCGIDTTRD